MENIVETDVADTFDPRETTADTALLASERGPMEHLQSCWQAVIEKIRMDWHQAKYFPYCGLLALINGITTAAFYVNHPQPDTYPDTISYLNTAHIIASFGRLANPQRTPAYPMLMDSVFLVTGRDNLVALGIVQGCLFVLATLEIYALTFLLFRRSWFAFLVGLLVGTNVYLLSFVKPILSEAITLWLTISLALAIALFLRSTHWRDLWLVALFLLALTMARFEWAFVAVPLLIYLLIMMARRGAWRRLLPHAAAIVVILYGMVGLYIYANGTQNGYWGVSYIQNINLLGKVVQYHMQDQAPSQYAAITQAIDGYVASGITSPYDITEDYRPLYDHTYSRAGDYASTIVKAHPVEFFVDTLLLIPHTFVKPYMRSTIAVSGPFGRPLGWMQRMSLVVFGFFQFFPICAIAWCVALFWRRTTRSLMVETMFGVVLVASYDLFMTTAGGYGDYPRFHIPSDPLMLLALAGTVWVVAQQGIAGIARLRAQYREAPFRKPSASSPGENSQE